MRLLIVLAASAIVLSGAALAGPKSSDTDSVGLDGVEEAVSAEIGGPLASRERPPEWVAGAAWGIVAVGAPDWASACVGRCGGPGHFRVLPPASTAIATSALGETDRVGTPSRGRASD